MNKKLGFITVLLLSMAGPCLAGNAIDSCMQQLQLVMKNCSMQYEMECTYPSGGKIKIKGVSAMKGNQYYDSSNLRLAIANAKCYIIIDHDEKNARVLLLKGNGGKGNVDSSISPNVYLFNESFFKKNAKYTIQKQNADYYWIELKVSNNPYLDKFVFQASKRDYKPVSYSAIIHYPLHSYAEEGGAEYVNVNFTCNSIKHPATDAFFDHTRILQEKNGKVTLKKYSNYQLYTTRP